MNKEFIAVLGWIFGVFVGLILELSVLVFLAVCAIIAIGCYSAYYFKGQKNYWYPTGVIGAFILFMASSEYPGGIICTLLMFVFLGSVLYFAWYVKKEPAHTSTTVYVCKNCGTVFSGGMYCHRCGAKIGTE